MMPAWSEGQPTLDVHRAAATLLERDVLTSTQHTPALTPERRLWLAVIADAVLCLQYAHDNRGWLARRWLLSKGFRDLCDNLGDPWNAEAIQARVKVLEIHPPKLKFRMNGVGCYPHRVVGKRTKRRRRTSAERSAGPAVVSSRSD